MGVGELGPDPQQSQRLAPGVNRLSSQALDDYEVGFDTNEQYQEALRNDDRANISRLEGIQRRQAGISTVEVIQNGGDPRYQTSPIGAYVSPEIEIERRLIEFDRKDRELNSVLQAPDSGFKEIQGFWSKIAEQYKAKNQSRIITQPKNAQEAEQQIYQNEPVVIDPNEVSNIRQMAVKLDIAMKQVDPTTSFFTNPKTKAFGEWLNRESGGSGVGYFTSGEQEIKLGAVGATAMMGVEAIEGLTDFGVSAVYGVWDLADRASRALGGPEFPPPQNYIEGPDGQIVANSGKAPGFMDTATMIFAMATERNVDETLANIGGIRALHAEQRGALENVAFGVSRVVGMGFGLGLPLGTAMNVGAKTFGKLTTGGLKMAAEAGVKGAGNARVQAVTQFLGKTFGAAAGNGAAEALAYGQQDGYAKSFVHGVAMAPALMAIGWMGHRVEHWATRKKMPKRMAAALGGAMEGVGFGSMEAAQMGSIWDFIKDPNEKTFETYAKNILGFALFKGAFTGGQTPGGGAHKAVASPETSAQINRGRERETFAKKVAKNEAKASEIADAPTSDVTALAELGEVASQRGGARTAEGHRNLAVRQKELEHKLDVEEFQLKGKSETELAKTETTNEDTSIPTRDEIEVVRQMPTGHAKNQKLIDMMKSARTGMAEAVNKYAAANTEAAVSQAKELYEAHATVNRMSGGKAPKRFEQAVGERISERDAAREQVSSEYRSYKEARLRDLVEREARISKEYEESTPLGGVKLESEMTTAEKEFRSKPATETNVRAERRGNLEGQLKSVRDEISKLKESISGRDSAKSLSKEDIAAMREIQEAKGPTETTLEMLESYQKKHPDWEPGAGGKKLMERLRAERDAKAKLPEQNPNEKPTEGRELLEKAGGTTTKVGPERRLAERRQVESKPAVERRVMVRGERKTDPHVEIQSGDDDKKKELGYKSLPAGERPGVGSLQVPPTRQLEATEGVQQQRASDIIAEMQGRPGKEGFRVPFTAKRIGGTPPDGVRMAMRTGRVGVKNYGEYKTYENLARTKHGNDLVVASHEWSHDMQRHALSMGGGKEFWSQVDAWVSGLPDQAIKEFDTILAGYPGTDRMSKKVKGAEAWAEWHARNLLGDETIQTQTPALTDVMQRFLADPINAPIRKQYQRIQDMLHRYQAQGALGRLRQSWINPADSPTETERATKPGIVKRTLTSLNKLFLDDMVELKQAQNEWLKASGKDPSKISILDDPARLADAIAQTAGKTTAHFIRNGFKSPAGDIPSYESIIKSVEGRQNEFTDYLVAVRNAQLLKRGKKAQQPMRDYAYAINQLQTAYPEFRGAARDLKRWTDALVDYAVDAGSLSYESGKKIKDAYVVYLPFFRAIEGPKAGPGGRGMAEKGSGVGTIHGHGAEVRDPLGNIQDVALSIVTKAHQQMVMQALYNMATKNEAGGLATIVPKDKVPHTHPVKMVLDALEKKLDVPDELWSELRDADVLNPEVVTFFSQKAIPTGTSSIIAFTPKGSEKPVWLEVDVRAYEALMGIQKSPGQGWLDAPVLREIMRYPAAMTRFFATGINIGFTVANIPRDILSYAVFSKSGEFRPLSGFSQWVKGMALYLDKGGDVRRMYEELGVKTSSFYSEGQRQDLLGQHKSIMQKSRHELATVVDKVKSFLEGPENFLRIAEFRDAYDKAKSGGASEMEARMLGLEAGREITVNFARAGIVSRVLNQIIPYFNPALQGQRKVWRQLAAGGDAKTDAGRAKVQRAAFANAIATITVPSLLLWWTHKDEEWYKDLPQWRKSMYFNTKIGDQIISVPKPWEIGVVFGSVPEAVADSMHKEGNPVDAGTLMRDAFLGYLDGPAALLPAFIRPLIEGQFNYKAFFRRRMTPDWIERGRVPEEQSTFYTTEIAKILSKAIGGAFTPIEIEHYLGGYTADVTTSVMRVADEILGLKDHPGLAINPIQRFMKQQIHGQSRFVDELYNLSIRLDQLEGSDRATPAENQLRTAVDQAKRNISAIRKAYQQGRMSRDEANRRSYELAKPLVDRSKK